MQAIEAFIAEQGGPEVIQWREVTLGAPAAGQVLVRQTAIGLNYIDTYHRDGTYPIELPGGLGVEAAGEVVATGLDVHGLQPGDRVATFGPQRGAYASARIVPAASLMKLPAGIDDDTAAAALLKACTVEALVERCAKIEAGWPVLVHAAAGGVGLILVQWLKAVGATVIGTVSTEAKAQTARDAGADHVIRYKQDDVAAHVREITDGQGVPVTFDGIGMATWTVSLKATARRGLIVSYGNAGGPVTGVNLGVLAQHGSQFVTRPTLFDYYLDPGERAAGAARVFEMIESGAVAITVGQRYGLQDAARAHADLEAGRTTGSSLLIP
ncbi:MULTISPECIES: quinone oxidoreductase family protein [Sphingopyxis]|uniref:quinone oxidoreductase family protein n=1 Tax=Sphingopyxis TaxID=165697 RepID=UPI00086CD75F|nr:MULTISPECIES: quinone oxidoreductase [Sphingopyxis]APW72050.1 quinone oxidoreductase [Sphingopyxis granuli]AVA12801.1 quinone oxidoreductase [Sphingopyxis sp. MG]ODU29415.1 MAG: quinone oxidoreductase [Sphingopyxis sp. SCN 67-31]